MGEAVPVGVLAVAVGADVEEGGAVPGMAVEEEHRDLAAGQRNATACSVAWAGEDGLDGSGYFFGLFATGWKVTLLWQIVQIRILALALLLPYRERFSFGIVT